MKYTNKPKAFISQDSKTIDELVQMLNTDPELYDKCLSTVGFAYGFSQLANKAVHFDYLKSIGVIPKEYPNEETEG